MGGALGNGEAYQPSFSLAGFQESKAKENMAFHFFFQRIHKVDRRPEFKPAVIQLRQFANPVNFWFSLSGTAFNKSERRFYNQEVIGEMPDGVPKPEENELVIQAPTAVEAGTIHLDRLFVAASRVSNLNSNRDQASAGLAGPKSGVGITTGIQPEPKHFTDLIPDSLMAEQQAYIYNLRSTYFNVPSVAHEEGSPKYNAVVDQAKVLLAIYCTQRENGTYTFKSEINFAGPGSVMFKGDLYIFRKFTHHLPAGVSHREHDVSARSPEIFNLFFSAPGNMYTKALFKAYVEWEKTYVYDPTYVPALGGKYGYQSAGARQVISVTRGDPGFKRSANTSPDCHSQAMRSTMVSFIKKDKKEIRIGAKNFLTPISSLITCFLSLMTGGSTRCLKITGTV